MLPSLPALRAFDAAARLGSFRAAAEALSISSTAISHHVRGLEEQLQVPLFHRTGRTVTLSDAGKRLAEATAQAFDMLGQAVHALRTRSAPHNIRIATLPSLAQLWLSGKLGELRRIAPEISVSVVAVEHPPNLAREPFDVSLFFQSSDPEPYQTALFRDRIFPVCTPDLASRLKLIADLAGETLIHDSAWAGDWAHWLQAVDGAPRKGQRGPVHSLFSVALEEACNGAGVLMAHEALVQSRLDSGRLVAPFPDKVALDRRLVLSCAPGFRSTRTFEKLLSALA